MYLQHFQLSQNPFEITSDPAFIWFGEKHKEALATLKYGFRENKSFLLLTGDVGLGKTSIINALLDWTDSNDQVVSIADPGLEKIEFFNHVAASFGMPETYSTKGAFIRDFKFFLLKHHHDGKKILLIIDESQRLTSELLEEIRLLADMEADGIKLMNVFFVGQVEFNEILMRPENRAIRQRITINYNIDPLTEQETFKYIAFRLVTAGAEKNYFTKKAIIEIHRFSKGYPRLINIIADRAMVTAYVYSKNLVTKAIVRECAVELDITQARGFHEITETVVNPNDMKDIRKVSDILEPIDSRAFRAAIDGHGLSRTSVLRMVLTRIHRAASDPHELQATIKEEAKRISRPSSRNELKALLEGNDVPFLRPILQMLRGLVFNNGS